ncbi:aminoglycoside 6'-N-acetyltransferase [Salinicoccus albus]|uniref:aminoglycoside 6'-N-acetyltransferase n=1 Tax=Salinicoccus albus TaxID=418756 RepID=UPI0003650746|nr:aminoglycoside 6'-N-acetyltransferase [Salinicoccus albus]
MIIQASEENIEDMTTLAFVLWHEDYDVLRAEMADHINDDACAYYIKMLEGSPVGFAECRLRHDYVEGTDSSPVGYLEGIFVLEAYRHRNYGSELVEACEKWAKGKGCSEFASDCETDNPASLQFHLDTGFEEMNRIICFRKDL